MGQGEAVLDMISSFVGGHKGNKTILRRYKRKINKW